MIALYILTAIFIAWIWVDYYRLIDIFESEKLKYFILTFVLGGLSVLIVLGLNYYVLDHLSFELNGGFVNDFLYSVLRIGVLEEFSKSIPFIILYFSFKNQFNEPIDYLAFMSVSALGFSAIENVLYFHNHGPNIINSRAILSTVGHMIDSAFIAYGIIRFKFHPYKKRKVSELILFFFLAALSHGFYDFWLIYEGTNTGGWIITIIYFLVTISVFAGILNNAINNSSQFSYKKVIDPNKVSNRLLFYYALVFSIQFALLVYTESTLYAITDLIGAITFSGFIVVVTCLRLSRFKLIKDRWEKLRIELPFSYSMGDPSGMRTNRYRIRIKGESFNESLISIYYEEFFSLNPVTYRNSQIGDSRVAFIERKLFLKYDETYFLAHVFEPGKTDQFERMLLKPKTADITLMNGKHPIVALLRIENMEDLNNPQASVNSFRFMEWTYIKPLRDTDEQAAEL